MQKSTHLFRAIKSDWESNTQPVIKTGIESMTYTNSNSPTVKPNVIGSPFVSLECDTHFSNAISKRNNFIDFGNLETNHIRSRVFLFQPFQASFAVHTQFSKCRLNFIDESLFSIFFLFSFSAVRLNEIIKHNKIEATLQSKQYN